jgi:hypothetical protein
MSPQKFYKGAKIIATLAICSQGLYYSIVQPGPMDAINGLVGGIVIYAIWFARERTQ